MFVIIPTLHALPIFATPENRRNLSAEAAVTAHELHVIPERPAHRRLGAPHGRPWKSLSASRCGSAMATLSAPISPMPSCSSTIARTLVCRLATCAESITVMLPLLCGARCQSCR